jgi:predicted nucleic acid-binding protein
MTAELCLIDTDILSYILKRKETAYQRSRDYLKKHERFTISCLTYYECFRGYKAVLDKAGEIYGVLKKKGVLPGEFDVLIGATALVHDYILITNNEKHYEQIKKNFPLKINNWMKV